MFVAEGMPDECRMGRFNPLHAPLNLANVISTRLSYIETHPK